jgi:hypothetical protein
VRVDGAAVEFYFRTSVASAMRGAFIAVLVLAAGCSPPSDSPAAVCYGVYAPPFYAPILLVGRPQTVELPLAGCDGGGTGPDLQADVRGPTAYAAATVTSMPGGLAVTFTPQEPGWFDVRVTYGPTQSLHTTVLVAADRTHETALTLPDGTWPLAVYLTENGTLISWDPTGDWVWRGQQRSPAPFAEQRIVVSGNVIWAILNGRASRFVDLGGGEIVQQPRGDIDGFAEPSSYFGNEGNLLGVGTTIRHAYVGDGALALGDDLPVLPGLMGLPPYYAQVWAAATEADGGQQECKLELDADAGWSCTDLPGYGVNFDDDGLWYLSNASTGELRHHALGPGGALASLRFPSGWWCTSQGTNEVPVVEQMLSADGGVPDDRILVPRIEGSDVVLEDWGLHGDIVMAQEKFIVEQRLDGGVRVYLR